MNGPDGSALYMMASKCNHWTEHLREVASMNLSLEEGESTGTRENPTVRLIFLSSAYNTDVPTLHTFF